MTSSLTNYDNKAYFGKYDEMYAQNNSIRPLYKQFSKILEKLSIEDLNKMHEFSKDFFLNQGVTFTVYNDKEGVEKIFPFDIIPRIINNKEWTKIEKGIKQRIKALNLFIKDIYHEQFFLKDNKIPADLIISNPNYLRIMRRLIVPKDIYTHISGIDLVRDENGDFFVLEDNLRTPSMSSILCFF